MSWVSDTQCVQPAGTSEKWLLVFWEQTKSVSTSSPRCSCKSNEEHHSQKEKLPVMVKCLQLLIGHLLVSTALIGNWWLSPGRLPLFTLCDLTPTGMKVTLTDAEQKLATWKGHGCFHRPLQSPVKLERTLPRETKRKSLPARAQSKPLCLFTNRDVEGLSCLQFNMLIISKREDCDFIFSCLFFAY